MTLDYHNKSLIFMTEGILWIGMSFFLSGATTTSSRKGGGCHDRKGSIEEGERERGEIL
jgi:hypothetical protein